MKILLKKLVTALMILGTALSQSTGAQEQSTRPNVLFIAVDDLRPELGCYGDLHIHSPNIDALAASGRRFERAYCQQAVCHPSRTSLMTGMRPESNGVTGNHSHFRTSITKWDTMGDPESWSAPAIRFGPRYYYTEEGIAAAKSIFEKVYQPKNPSPDDWTKKLVFGPATESPDVPDSTLYDGQVADAAVETLQQLKGTNEPFFLAVGFIKPHSPYIAPKKYFALYKDVALPTNTEFPTDAPSFAGHGSGELRRYTDQPKRGAIAEANQRRVRQAYFACISYIDAQAGRVLDELERSGLSENTIVVLWGDHGYHLGEQGLWGKSFVPILNDPTQAAKTAALIQYPRGGGLMGCSMRTATHRLTQWVHRQSGEVRATELYDYTDRLAETENIASKAPKVVEQLSAQLQTAFALNLVNPENMASVSFEKAKPGLMCITTPKLSLVCSSWNAFCRLLNC